MAIKTVIILEHLDVIFSTFSKNGQNFTFHFRVLLEPIVHDAVNRDRWCLQSQTSVIHFTRKTIKKIGPQVKKWWTQIMQDYFCLTFAGTIMVKWFACRKFLGY